MRNVFGGKPVRVFTWRVNLRGSLPVHIHTYIHAYRRGQREGGGGRERGGESVRWLVRVSRMCRLRTLQSRDSIMSACARFVIVITGICISSDESLWPCLCFVSWHADLSCTVIVDARYNRNGVLHETDLRFPGKGKRERERERKLIVSYPAWIRNIPEFLKNLDIVNFFLSFKREETSLF